MKNALFALATILCIGFATTYAYDPTTDVSSGAIVNKKIKHQYYRESSTSYDLYISSGVYLFKLNTGLQTIWNESGTTARNLQSQHTFDLVVNAGYFTYHKDINSFRPAGRIVNGRSVINSTVKEFWAKNLDHNLAITITYNTSDNIMDISHNDLVIPQPNTYAFYAGPYMIQSGQILTNINANLSHRQRKATRTFLIIDQYNKPHLGVSIQGYTLPALAQKIQEMNIFSGSYHVINLDGGSSTALAAGTRYRNSRVRLPWFFGVK